MPNLDLAEPGRRDFLFIGACAVVATGATIWPLVDALNPDASSIAVGAPVDVDLGGLEPGGKIVVRWRGLPVVVIARPAAALEKLRDPALISQLADPDSEVLQQPRYARNWRRSIDPVYAVLVGVCTHLGCIPLYYPNPSDVEPTSDWPGGFFCPCHGSRYDLAGRVYKNMPAPYNLPAPPYRMVDGMILRIGENPPGDNFEITSIVQI
ncbi:MAG: ubiquinol-cytochrome c reductase iron-sulfur subunit [Methylocystaceae bacterium]|nr:MAG: ubiquinol-cytochrome c reductase iron-sulfur subunit [Methylocystaceae bacterium]